MSNLTIILGQVTHIQFQQRVSWRMHERFAWKEFCSILADVVHSILHDHSNGLSRKAIRVPAKRNETSGCENNQRDDFEKLFILHIRNVCASTQKDRIRETVIKHFTEERND